MVEEGEFKKAIKRTSYELQGHWQTEKLLEIVKTIFEKHNVVRLTIDERGINWETVEWNV